MQKTRSLGSLLKKGIKQQKSFQATQLSSLPSGNLVLPGQKMNGQSNQKKIVEYQYMGVNQVLQYRFAGQKSIFYVPCYLRMKINKIQQINYIESKALIQAEIRIWLMIKKFPQIVQQQIINQAKLQINRSTVVQFQNIREPPKLDQSQIKNKSKNSVGFLYCDRIQLSINSDPFLSPYEQVDLYSTIEIKKIVLGYGNPQFQKNIQKYPQCRKYLDATVQFNFMDAVNPFLQFSFGQSRSLGCFDIVQSKLDMKFSNTQIQQDQQQQQNQSSDQYDLLKQYESNTKKKQYELKNGNITPDAYEHGMVLIPLYKYPSTTLINIFVPLYVVGIVSIGVFFQQNDMSNRDGGLSTFLLTYIAFLPSIRQNLPSTPKIVFTQILAYTQIACSLICFFYSLSINKIKQYGFQWSKTPAFIICVILTLLNMAIVIGMFIVHKTVWQRRYNKLPKGSIKYMEARYMDTDNNQQWFNPKCDQQFRPAIEQAQVVRPFQKIMKNKQLFKQESQLQF